MARRRRHSRLTSRGERGTRFSEPRLLTRRRGRMAMVTQTARPGGHRPATRTPPMLSGAMPLVGHAIEFGHETIGLLHRAHREHGDVAGFKLAHKAMYLLTGPAASEAFFRAPDQQLIPH